MHPDDVDSQPHSERDDAAHASAVPPAGAGSAGPTAMARGGCGYYFADRVPALRAALK